MIADHATPKSSTGGVAYGINSKDYKGAMIIVISEEDRCVNGKQPSGKLLRTGCIQRHADNGEK